MQSFAPGDRVVAINTDMSGPICGPQNPEIHPFLFPDGPLRSDVVYHVTRVGKCRDGNQALWLTGMRVFWGPTEMSWSSTRFRKVQEAGHPPLAIKKKHPTPRVRPRERRHPGAPTSPSALFPLHTQANEDVGVPGTLPSRLSNRHAPPLTDPSPPPAAKLPFIPADPTGKSTNGRTDHEAAVRGPKNLQSEIASGSEVSCFTVDTHNIVPVWVASDKREVGAYTMRPKLHKLFGLYLTEPGQVEKHPHEWPGPVQSMRDLQSKIQGVINKVPNNGTKISFTPGNDAAKYHLEKFIKEKLESYAVDRHDPSSGSQSDLSPYLHFGQLSSLQVALRLREVAIENGSDLHYLTSAKMPQPEEAKKTILNGIDSLIEEMVVRKELADNYCHHCKDYDNIGAAPEWARKSLDAHREDERDHLYTIDKLEHAKTHDDAWNAAQRQLTSTGKMHGYMRMYWAKKIIEWSKTYQEAYYTTLKLNNMYFIDGRDPVSFASVAWNYGKHDRAWNERPIFGKLRYMNLSGLERKFNMKAYVSYVDSL
jgi:deoxyribodipyrimidine photo-lyase